MSPDILTLTDFTNLQEAPRLHKVDVLDLAIASLTADQLSQNIGHYIETQQKKKVLYINVHGVNLCFRHPWLYDFYNDADILFCDGAGLRLGATILGRHILERITLADWMWQFAEYAEPKQYTMFFLGGVSGVAERAIVSLKAKYPRLKIAGHHHGFFNKEKDSAENRQIVDMINQARPNILWVGFGMPIQEKWIQENWSDLNVNIVMNSGAMLDYISGNLHRAPRWLTDNGLEWLGRLIIEPRRLWRRYLIGNPLFLLRLLIYKRRELRKISLQ